MQIGVVEDAQGSVFFEAGQNKLIVAVHGPKPVAKSSNVNKTYHPKGVIHCQVEFLPGCRGPQHLPEVRAQIKLYLHFLRNQKNN